MYTCECTVRRTFNKCDNKLHIQALDYRAATFEDIKELERAQKDAEWMLELAPRLPDVRNFLPPKLQYVYHHRVTCDSVRYYVSGKSTNLPGKCTMQG
jgi:hypothetical protein